MEILKQKVLECGKLKPNNVLKVDSFLNHQIDVSLLDEICNEFIRLNNNQKIDKILTIEASGIAIGTLLASKYNVNLVFAKKSSKEVDKETFYETKVYSYTHSKENYVFVNKEYLNENENIFIVDDFLANGEALLGLIDLVNQAKANIANIGIVIEKSFQDGRKKVLAKGYNVNSLVRIKKLDYENNKIEFEE